MLLGIIFAIIVAGTIFYLTPINNNIPADNIILITNNTQVNNVTPINTTIATNTTIIEESLPMPNYEPVLREYKIDKSRDIWRPQNPSSYIIPNNEWVKYYANKLYIDINGKIHYKSNNNVFTNIYISDDNYPNKDYWLNADYYLTHNMSGDCEDFAIALVSILKSGELVDQNGNKVNISAKLAVGYDNGYRHTWVEYDYNGITYIGDSPNNQINVEYFPIDNYKEEYVVDTYYQ